MNRREIAMLPALRRWETAVATTTCELAHELMDADAARACGVTADWLAWHRRDNRMGAAGLVAVVGYNRRAVRGLDDLAQVFEEMTR